MNHDVLIEELCRSATPVRRPLPSLPRAMGIAIVSLALGWVAVDWLAAGARPSFVNLNGAGSIWGTLELAMTFMTGLTALLCAFEMSIAGRSPRGLFLAAGSFLGWLAISLSGIAASGASPGLPGDGLYCFGLVLAAGAPMMLLVILALRRTRALQPARTLSVAGVGVASLALSLLALCHPFELRLIDFLMHVAAAACIVLLMALLGRRWISVPRTSIPLRR